MQLSFYKKILAVFTIALLFTCPLSILFSWFDEDEVVDFIEEREDMKSSAIWIIDEAIEIDDALSNNWSVIESSNLWCTGSGNETDPYVIQNLFINGGESTTNKSGIYIYNSEAHFRIENCTIFNNAGLDESGIYLSQVDNGEISGNDLFDTSRGLTLTGCENMTIHDNTITSSINNNGITMLLTELSNVTGNDISNSDLDGISMVFSNDISIQDNEIINSRNGIGMFASEHVNISVNTISNSETNGIGMQDSNNISIQDNEILDSKYSGIGILSCSNINIEDNNVHHNEIHGIGMTSCDYNVIRDNTISNNGHFGIGLNHSSHNNITHNVLRDNRIGCIGYDSGSQNNIIASNICDYNYFLYFETELGIILVLLIIAAPIIGVGISRLMKKRVEKEKSAKSGD